MSSSGVLRFLASVASVAVVASVASAVAANSELDSSEVTDSFVETVYVESGSNASLPCPAASTFSTVRHLEWRCRGCNGSALTHESLVVEYSANASVGPVSSARVGLAPAAFGLQLSPVVAFDSGDYVCVVNARKKSAVVRLVVRDISDPPGRPLIMAFTSRSVNLSWTPPLNTHNSPISHYLIHIRVGEDGVWDSDGNILETSDNATVFGASGLQPFTTYSFRVTAVNAVGRSQHSKESYYMLTLREVPSGKPWIVSAHNASSTSVLLEWQAPAADSVHGEFLGYRIAYRPEGSETVSHVLIKDPSVTKHWLPGLAVFTRYIISIQVYNPEGFGPATTVVVTTDEGVPSAPTGVRADQVSNTSVSVRWQRPASPNGIVNGYRLYYMRSNYTDVHTARDTAALVQYHLTGLEPFTRYKMWVKAFTWRNEGDPSEPVEVLTDVSSPGAPTIANVTCADDTSAALEWDKPTEFYNNVDSYFVYYGTEGSWRIQEVASPHNESKTDVETPTKILLSNLTAYSVYEVKVRGATRSLYNGSAMYAGAFSDPVRFLVQADCSALQVQSGPRASHASPDGVAVEVSVAVIAGGICVAFAVCLALIAGALWRNYFKESYYYLDSSPSASSTCLVPDWDREGRTGKDAVSAQAFVQHVAANHVNMGFNKEFYNIQAVAKMDGLTADLAYLEDNKLKNRYHNVVAYDHSRVQLRPLPGQKRGEYVNANFVDGFQKSRAYIATQGPLPATFDSFWRMVWEQRVKVIVMITNLVERGKRKCDLYWPMSSERTRRFGLLEVSVLEEHVLATYTMRTFKLRHVKIRSRGNQKHAERTVVHFQYTHWPDHGVPDNPLPVLAFVKKSSAESQEADGPIVVHCSAGVGRTGAYIVLDTMLKQMRTKGELSLMSYLRHIRTQRNFLVETEEQYVFVHDALVEAIVSGDTNVHCSYLSRYLGSLQSSVASDKDCAPWQMLERQFRLATAFRPQEAQFAAALKACNQSKNQNFDFLPVEASRVSISPRPGVEGSDYINASWLPGFHRLNEFIVTQHPIGQSVYDFWHMLWDHGISTVVVLSALQQTDFEVFWPSRQSDFDTATLRVCLTDESVTSGYRTKNFTLISLKGELLPRIGLGPGPGCDAPNAQSVRVLFCPSWPHHCSPLSHAADVVRVAQAAHLGHGPIVVVDKFGGTEAATFCAIATLLRQLQMENHVDVYSYAKMAHKRRPGIWKCADDYLFLYRVLESVCANQDAL